MSVVEEAYRAAQGRTARVVMPESDEPRIAAAAARLRAEGVAEVLTLADARAPEAYADVVPARSAAKLPALARRNPMVLAAAMVAAGEADAMIAGAATPTEKVIMGARFGLGLIDGVTVPSSFFVMSFPDGRDFIFADCAVNVAPDAETLASIARAAGATGAALLGEARVALLSFSTLSSGAGPSVDLVRRAAEMVPGAIGPVQADAALNPAIAAKKGIEGGDANVLIFPSLDAGNIAYKLAQELGGAQAVGPFLQGFRRPVCDLSRGATVEDIVAGAVVMLAMG